MFWYACIYEYLSSFDRCWTQHLIWSWPSPGLSGCWGSKELSTPHLTTSSSLHSTFSTFYIRNFHAWLIRSIMFLGQLINSQWGFNHTSYNITGHNQFAKNESFLLDSLSIFSVALKFSGGKLSWWACPCLPWSSCWWEKGKMKEIQFHPHIIPCTISYNCK